MDDKSVKYIVLSFYLFCEFIAFILSVLGNFLVIYSIISKKELSRTSNKYILSVSFADFLIGLLVIPFGVFKVRNVSYWLLSL